MLSYRHSFHAGNHADVLKHIVLSRIIESLKEKEKGFLYLDTHAGAGCYYLESERAEKTGEYLQGIARLWQQPEIPTLLLPYMNAIHALNQKSLKHYPGSPVIARHLLREQDQLHLTELHPSDYPLLRHEFLHDNRAKVLRADGYQQLKTQLPPKTRRGLVLIDPSYELKTDYLDVVKAVEEGYKRFATGVYAIWYPVVLRQQVKKMLKALEATGIKKILQIELAIRPDNDKLGMTASGMIVINPPWLLKQEMDSILPWLHKVLVPEGYGHAETKWLATE